MRRLLVVLLGLCLLVPSPIWAADWTTRGGSGDRSNLSHDSFGAVDVSTYLWDKPAQIGATGAQPLIIGDKVYQLGGQRLWEIDVNSGTTRSLLSGTGRLSDGSWRPSTSGIAYAVVDGKPRLYFGTGNNSVCVTALDGSSRRCHRLHPDAAFGIAVSTPPEEDPIVTTPLVMTATVDGRELDFVVMGDKQGRLWVLQGLGTFDYQYKVQHFEVGGWILASMVQIAPLTFVWGNTNGWVYAHTIRPSTAGKSLSITQYWNQGFHTPGQVADGFAKVRTATGDIVFLIDSVGNLQQIRASTGEAQTLHLNNVHFTNMSPAIDDQNIYLSIRETREGGPGALIAVDRSTLQEKWRSLLTTKANTNPLVLPKANAVLIGDTLGALHAFAIDDGRPITIFQGDTPLYELASLPAPLDPLGQSYQTLTGISETILAGDPPMLITGISGANKGQPDGYLFAYRTLPAFDVGWVDAKLEPTTGQARIRLNSGDETIEEIQYAFFWQPQGATQPTQLGATQTVTLAPNEEKTVNFQPQTGPGTLTGVVNPASLIKDGHSFAASLQGGTWTQPKGFAETPGASKNNIISGDVTAVADLAVTLQASSTYDCLAAKSATVTFQNPSPTALKAQVQVRLGSTNLLSGTLTLAPGANTRSLTLAGIPCGSSATLRATIAHQDPALTESNLANNQASTSVSVGNVTAVTGQGPTVIMVPDDCKVNPDWTSSYPCLNYPSLYVP